jgi:hypothetical protein
MCRDLQGTPPRGDLNGLEIQSVNGGGPYERRDLGEDFSVQGFFDPPFFAVSSETASADAKRASHICSLSSTKSRTKSLNRLCTAICSWVRSTASGGMIFVSVFPPTTRVSDQYGPCPRSPGCEQWHAVFPHRRYRATNAPGLMSPTDANVARTLSRFRSNSATDPCPDAILHLLF